MNHLFNLVERAKQCGCIYIYLLKARELITLLIWMTRQWALPWADCMAEGEVLHTFTVRWPGQNSSHGHFGKETSEKWTAVSSIVDLGLGGLHQQRWVGWPPRLSAPKPPCRTWMVFHEQRCSPTTMVPGVPGWRQILTMFSQHRGPTPIESHEKWTEVGTGGEAVTEAQPLFPGHYPTKITIRGDSRKLPSKGGWEGGRPEDSPNDRHWKTWKNILREWPQMPDPEVNLEIPPSMIGTRMEVASPRLPCFGKEH